jgi:hypothetical protein
MQAIGSEAATTAILPTALQCALLSPGSIAAPVQSAAQTFLVTYAETMPPGAVHRLILLPLLLQLRRGEHVLSALLLVRDTHPLACQCQFRQSLSRHNAALMQR